MKIQTKKSIEKFYITTILGLLFFIGIGCLLITIHFQELEKKGNSFKPYILLLFGIGVILLGFYSVFRYYKNSPTVKVFDDKIQINRKLFSFNDIETIYLTGKMPFRYIVNFPMEGIYLRLKSNEEIFLFDDMYSNLWMIKDYINKVYLNNETFKNPETKEKFYDKNELFYFYSGFQIFSFRGILLWFLLTPILFSLIFKNQNFNFIGAISIIIFVLFWFYFNSWLMHHYGVSKKFLLIKNTNLPWKKKLYSLDEIKEIVFESEGKMPNCLRVITNDFQSKLYPGSTLSETTWIQLKTDLRNKKVIVRDECIEFD